MTSSGGARRCGGGRQPAVVGDNGYVETDPTGRYGRFDEVLGKGAMKSVYRGFDEERGVEVAWNQASLRDVLRSPDAVQRMYCEVQLLSTLRHDAIISFHASWVDAPRRTFNFITELFSSGTLRSFRRRYPRVSPRAVRSWARQVLRGLAYLHAHDPPVIHRDLKCDNLFVNGHLGQVKIGDLGLAAVLREAGQAAHSVIGTPEFMAPEMYDEEYDERVDVYSFGMCVLEMITLELPYAECSNPAQIYKKVTAGKLPDAFYRVRDDDARRFIGRCLVAAADRPSAAELLHDPFLLDDHHPSPVSPRPPPPSARSDVPGVFASSSSATTSDDGSLSSSSDDHHQPPPAAKQQKKKNDMTITGKLNAEEDTIFLKVQIVADATGHVRNIYFPFDVAGDTATDVAWEMVKELDITDRDPSEIAAVIEQEIRRLLPRGRGREQQQQHEYSYSYDDEDENGEQPPPPFYYLSSSPASSVGGLSVGGPQRSTSWSKDHYYCYPLSDDDDTSSMHSGKYDDLAHHHVLPEGGEEKMHGGRPSSSSSSSKACCNPSRLGPLSPPGDTISRSRVVPAEPRSRVHAHVGRPRRRNNDDDGKQVRFSRNRSMVDMRSQLLHRTLVEELNRRLFFNTVGAVENIGFRAPPGYGGGSSSSSTRGRGSRRSRDA